MIYRWCCHPDVLLIQEEKHLASLAMEKRVRRWITSDGDESGAISLYSGGSNCVDDDDDEYRDVATAQCRLRNSPH